MAIFKPVKIIDLLTGKERVVSPEEQEEMLDKGIFFDISVQSDKNARGLNDETV